MKRTQLTFLAILYLLHSCAGESQESQQTNDLDNAQFQLVAHRGIVNDTIIENSEMAILESIERGYVMIETDIRFTKDGIPVVHHDANFFKVYNIDKPVSETLSAELKDIVHPDFGFSPLTLEALVALTGGKAGLIIDVKGGNHPDEYYESIALILEEAGIYTKSRVAWSEESRTYFRQRGGIKIGIDSDEFREMREQGLRIDPENYFLVENSQNLSEFEIEQALALELEIIASLNSWQFRNEPNHLLTAKQHFERTARAGVRTYLIDAVYEYLFPRGK